MKTYDVAVVGATGLVGRKIIQVLEEQDFPIGRIAFFASERSIGKQIEFKNKACDVHKISPEGFRHIHIALFSAGAAVAKEFAPHAVKHGTLVIDNSSAFRMEKHVPLVVPEVNRKEIFKHKGIISNPNCSTIQLVVVLKPLNDKYKIKRVVVSTYQSVTGAGKRAVDQLEAELKNEHVHARKFPHPIALNVIPHIDLFFDDGYSKEEWKIINETKKILGNESIKVTATCARVPVVGGHSESVNIEFEKNFDLLEVREILRTTKGLVVMDDPQDNIYPMPIIAHEKDQVFVGRIRRDETVKYGLNLWIVADNLRKGAATNAVQIAQEWIQGK